MRIAVRSAVILAAAVLLVLPAGLYAQETPADVPTETSVTLPAPQEPEAAEPARSSYELRSEFSRLLREHPASLSSVLKLEPALLSNSAFLAGYPELARFVEANPAIRRNPHFYLAEFTSPLTRQSPVEEMIEPLAAVMVFALIAFALAWLVRTIIDQKRWNRLTKTQTEVHNKILDRFGTSAELLDYVRSPAGTKFLESAPIPLRAELPGGALPAPRVMWSVQIGIIIAAAALGLLLVGLTLDGESAQGFYGLGIIAFFIGAGFIASAVVSIMVSRRMMPAEPAEGAGESGLVR
jgi:hypothetical protein